MKAIRALLGLTAALLFSSQAWAITINFNDTEVPTIINGQAVTIEWAAYGVIVSDAYWYRDSRDPFDEMGLSVAFGAPNNTARIDIIGGTNSVTVDWWSIVGQNSIDAYDAANTLIDSFVGASGGSGTETLTGGNIAYITWHDTGGFVQISTLTFGQVPEPATLALLGIGLAGLGFSRRKRAARS